MISTWKREYHARVRKAAEQIHTRQMQTTHPLYLVVKRAQFEPVDLWGGISTVNDLEPTPAGWELWNADRLSRARTVDGLEQWLLSLNLPIINSAS
jgi:hypothetical protein